MRFLQLDVLLNGAGEEGMRGWMRMTAWRFARLLLCCYCLSVCVCVYGGEEGVNSPPREQLDVLLVLM